MKKPNEKPEFKFKVEKEIPIPPKSCSGRPTIYPLEIMAVGDSFFVPDAKTSSINTYNYSAKMKKLGHDWKFTARSVKDATGKHLGIRVWRIK